jgi:hypothetical protein
MVGGGKVQISDAEEIVIEAPDSVYRKGTMVLRRTQIDDGTPWVEGEALIPDIQNLALTWIKVKVVAYKDLQTNGKRID